LQRWRGSHEKITGTTKELLEGEVVDCFEADVAKCCPNSAAGW